MAGILFSHSYILLLDEKQRKIGIPYPPLGTLYAAAWLKHHGYQVSVFDAMFANGPQDIRTRLSQGPEYFVLVDDSFNYLTKMCLTNMREAAFEMIRLARAFGCKVIVSSSDAADHYEIYLEHGADFVIIGETEQTLLELMNCLERQIGSTEQIDGLAFYRSGIVKKTARRNVMKKLDELPFPAWDMIDLEPYKKSWLKHVGYFSINVVTTRGCPFKCNWCAKPVYGNRYNARSPQNVVSELKWLSTVIGFDHVWFCDDIFGLKPGWVREFADLVEAEKLAFRFKIQCRADLLLENSFVQSLKRAGCESVWMGAESGSQRILNAMDKGITVQQIEQATTLLKQHHVRPSFFIQFGYPGEMMEDIRETIGMINRLLPAEIGISVSYPLPGTVFYERVKTELVAKANWKDSDDLALLFRNVYHRDFYRQLHRYVHFGYKKHLALNAIKSFIKTQRSDGIRLVKTVLSCLYYAPATAAAGVKLNLLKHKR